MANEKARYSDKDLEEFRAIIEEKLKVAKQTYRECMAQLNHSDSNDVVDTSPTYKALEEGSEAQSKEEIIRWHSASRSLSRDWRQRWFASRTRLTASTARLAS